MKKYQIPEEKWICKKVKKFSSNFTHRLCKAQLRQNKQSTKELFSLAVSKKLDRRYKHSDYHISEKDLAREWIGSRRDVSLLTDSIMATSVTK